MNLQLTINISKAWYGYHFSRQIGSKKKVWKDQPEKTTLPKNLCMNSFHKYLDNDAGNYKGEKDKRTCTGESISFVTASLHEPK